MFSKNKAAWAGICHFAATILDFLLKKKNPACSCIQSIYCLRLEMWQHGPSFCFLPLQGEALAQQKAGFYFLEYFFLKS